jgi:uncharacterized protein
VDFLGLRGPSGRPSGVGYFAELAKARVHSRTPPHISSGSGNLNAALPATIVGLYPQSHGWLHIFDSIVGIGLVAYSEEIIFRHCALSILRPYFGEGGILITMTSLLFGMYHWWTGIGNIAEAVLIGALLMLFYRKSMALWPVVLAHYLTDVVDFAF